MRFLVFASVLASVGIAVLSIAVIIQAGQIDSLRGQVRQLEIHDCGLTQFEDYSVSFQHDDATRLRCVAAMQP